MHGLWGVFAARMFRFYIAAVMNGSSGYREHKRAQVLVNRRLSTPCAAGDSGPQKVMGGCASDLCHHIPACFSPYGPYVIIVHKQSVFVEGKVFFKKNSRR